MRHWSELAYEFKVHFSPTLDVPQTVLRSLGFDPKKEELERLVMESEFDHDCSLTLIDFQKVVERAVESLSPEAELTKAFNFIDRDKKGFINVDDLRRIDSELGYHLSEDELVGMIAESGGSSNGKVTLEEFLRCALQS